MKLPAHIEDHLMKCNSDMDDALLEYYYQIAASNNYLERRNLKRDYNILAQYVNDKRNHQVYKQLS